VRSDQTTKSGTRNLRRCCTLSLSPRASCGTISSRSRSRSSQASPWEKFYIVVTPWDISSSGRSS
jgi:hypothetical protein